MINVRIVEIQPMKVVTSGPIRTQDAFEAFCNWWTEYDRKVAGKITPRDFMWYNEREQATEWIYALPVPETGGDYAGYEARQFGFGLYAVASNIDADCDGMKDWMETKTQLAEYVEKSGIFEVSSPKNDNFERYPMFHIVTPQSYFERTGIHQQDMYMPIVYKD